MLTRISLNSLVIGIVILLANSCSTHKTGYVDLFKLVQEFELQKEYSEEAKKEIDREKSIIDSVIYVQKIANPGSYESVKEELYTVLYKKTEERNKEIEKMIWKRLNPYLADYGKENKYKFIYGANGTGTVLYADDDMDITEEVISYVNKRYHDKK